ncbi:hypothetical protein [Streptomyces iranensis]|uniref:hypothetical protein n=1 Tax=Streptomyces iranensis TaxID=576784 RepID=UPI0039B72EC0
MTLHTAETPVSSVNITVPMQFELLDADPADGFSRPLHAAREAHYTLPARPESIDGFRVGCEGH